MKKYITIKICSTWSLAIAFMALVAGCGSGAITSSDAGGSGGGGLIVAGVGTGGTGVVTSASGDTYTAPLLINAIVFLDKNGNRLPDSGEPAAVTDAEGTYTLPLDPADAAACPLLMQAVAGSTIIKATGRLVAESYVIEVQPK